MLDRILFGASQSKTTAQSAAWAEAHEKEADELAAWAEAHEKIFEQQARRAEQIAERMEERMLKRSERLAEQFARQAEQTADALQTFSPLPEKPLDREAANQPTAYSQHPADDRRTEIIDAALSASTLEEYSAQILSRLYKVLDPSDSVVGRVEEIRRALVNQDVAALNEFAPILDAHIGPEWLEEYAVLCPDAEIPPDFEQQIDLALTQCNWNWIEDHAHLISDPDMIRRIVLASTTEGFFDFVPLFADQLDQQSINDAARLAVRMNCTDDILPVAGRVSPGILD